MFLARGMFGGNVAAVCVPAPATPPTPVAQPANWALSWHEMNPLRLPDGSIAVGGTDGIGDFKAMSVDGPTGIFTKLKEFTPRISTQDDHNIFSPFRSAAGTLMFFMGGHASNYVGGAVKNEIRAARGADFDSVPLDRASMVKATLTSNHIPNYVQAHQTPGGKIFAMYVNDTAAECRFIVSDDDGATWLMARPVGRLDMSGGGWVASAQLYFRLDVAGIFTGTVGSVTSTFLPIYLFIHASEPQAPLRYIYLDMADGKCYSPTSGGVINSGANSFTASTTQMINMSKVATNANPDIRVPAAGRTQRVNMVRAGIFYLTDMTQDPAYGDGKHIVNKLVGGTRQEFELGASGVAFWSSYLPDIQPGTEPHTGDLIYRCVNDGSAYNSGSKLIREHYPTGIENGGKVATTVLEAGVTPGIDATDAILRYFPVEGAQSGEVAGFAWVVDSYTTYTSWSGGRFVPVMAM